jgi:enamine deaminase RidA (YjgF/YER057c/UK114 family)
MPDRAHAVLVRHPRLIFTAAQMAFRDTNEDIRLAYERLGKTIEDLGASYDQVVASHIYALTNRVQALATDLRGDFVSPDARPARSIEVFEGLPSIDASMAVEIVAAGN